MISENNSQLSADTEDSVCIVFDIVNPKLISVNDQYMHPVRKCKDGRHRSYVIKSPYLKEVQQYYQEVLSERISEEWVEKLKNVLRTHPDDGLSIEFHIGIPEKEFYEHDGSNYIKAIEDCIATYLKIDDKYNTKVLVEKMKVKESNDWSLTVIISNIYIREL